MTFKKLQAVEKPDTALSCSAHGCPLPWSVEGGKGRLCSFHAWSEPDEWFRITVDLQNTGPWLLDRREAIELKDEFRCDPRGWAKRLIKRHEAGEKLNQTALQMAKDALRYRTEEV